MKKFDGPVGSIQMLGKKGRKTLQRCNSCTPILHAYRVEDKIHKRCLDFPTLPAVCAWDGDFTYLEVDTLSSNLAHHLAKFDIRPDTYIPLCFEKSCWTTIAMLAVMKIGGAFILLDPSFPVQRLQEICEISRASLIISSERQYDKASNLVKDVITIGHSAREWPPRRSSMNIPRDLSPKDALYAVFTSGSTGISVPSRNRLTLDTVS